MEYYVIAIIALLLAIYFDYVKIGPLTSANMRSFLGEKMEPGYNRALNEPLTQVSF